MRVTELANRLDIKYEGEDFEVEGISTLSEATRNEISFLENQKYLKDLPLTKAGAVFIREEQKSLLPKGVYALVTENPYLSMAYASKYFAKKLIREKKFETKIGKNCIIDEKAHIGVNSQIGDGTIVFAGAFIGDNVTIGKNCVIYPNVTIYNDTVIGDDCRIHAGAVIGSDGFGYAHTKDGKHVKIYHNGRVVIENEVEIGANTTIDRAVFGSTIIKRGSIIDNLVQIGHNCEIGEYSVIVAQTGLSGSSKLGRGVIMGGQSATAGHLKIGDYAVIAARGGVTKSIKGGETYSGFPLMRHKEWLKLQGLLSRILKSKEKSR